jgi:DNA polymerase-3 subunit delta'
MTADAPWLTAPIAQLRRAHAAGRFPAAVLIHEQRGAGGEALARFAAQLALCRGQPAPCGQCRDCRQMAAGQHPDFISVGPLEDSRIIRVEQIRELCEQLALTAHGGRATVAMIAPADSMNANAANALLKTLEEPRAGVTLILVSAVPSQLPATIISRCQRLRVNAPTRAQSLAWLARWRGPAPWEAVLDVLGEAPFAALLVEAAEVARLQAETVRILAEALAGRGDFARTADAWGRADSYELRLACVENWLTARIDGALRAARQPRELGNGAHLSTAGSDLNMALLLRLLDSVYELRRLRLSSLNRPLALEQLLWELAQAGRGRARRAASG